LPFRVAKIRNNFLIPKEMNRKIHLLEISELYNLDLGKKGTLAGIRRGAC
jgi:hypothetical protein